MENFGVQYSICYQRNQSHSCNANKWINMARELSKWQIYQLQRRITNEKSKDWMHGMEQITSSFAKQQSTINIYIYLLIYDE